MPKHPKEQGLPAHFFNIIYLFSATDVPTTRITSPKLLVVLSFLLYVTVTHCLILFFFPDLRKNEEREYFAEQEGPFQCDLKPLGITLCPTENESENLTKHEETCLVHSQTDTLLIHKQLCFFSSHLMV